MFAYLTIFVNFFLLFLFVFALWAWHLYIVSLVVIARSFMWYLNTVSIIKVLFSGIITILILCYIFKPAAVNWRGLYELLANNNKGNILFSFYFLPENLTLFPTSLFFSFFQDKFLLSFSDLFSELDFSISQLFEFSFN